MAQELKINKADVLASAAAMFTIAHALMRGFIRSQQDEIQFNALRDLVIGKLKNADIAGIGYGDQALLVSKTLQLAEEFFEQYRQELRKLTKP